MDSLKTVPETGQIIGQSSISVWRLIARGELRSVKIGRSRRIPASEIDRFINEKVAEAAR